MKETKKKILFLDHTPFVGGAQLSLIQHLEKINRDKFNVIIACSKKAEELGLIEQYNSIGIKYYFISFGKLKSFNPVVFYRFIKSVFEIKKLIKKEKISLVVSNTVRTALAGSLAAWLSNIKIIWFIRDFTFPLLFFRLFSYFPKKIVFNSKATALHYKNYFGDYNKQEIVYIGRNFYEKVKSVSNSVIDKQKKEWEVDNETIVIGYIGRLVKDKGPQTLIKAIELLINQGVTNIKCVIVGSGRDQEGNNEAKLKKMVRDNNLENYIIFIGYQKEITITTMALNIFVLPSIALDSFPSSIVDAMMAKVPVIGTNTGGTPEIIKDYQTGLLVEPNNEVDLGEAIKKLINDKVLRERVVKNAYNRVMKYHTAEFTTKQLENIYFKILGVNLIL